MKDLQSNVQPNQKAMAAPSMAAKSYQARLLDSLLALKPPVLLVGLPEPLILGALRQGLEADVCDDSLEKLGHLARQCLNDRLSARLYWQPLASLSLPQRYANIVLAPQSWQALARRAEAKLIQRQLQAQLSQDGQLKLLLSQPSGLASVAA